MVDLHQTVRQDGMMRMDAVEHLAVPAGGAVALDPGGFHLMIMGLKRPLKVGETVDLTFTFAKAGAVTVTAKVAPLAATKAPD